MRYEEQKRVHKQHIRGWIDSNGGCLAQERLDIEQKRLGNEQERLSKEQKS